MRLGAAGLGQLSLLMANSTLLGIPLGLRLLGNELNCRDGIHTAVLVVVLPPPLYRL